MTNSANSQAARWIPLLVIGMLLNTLGIALRGAGAFRFVLMGAGVLLLLVCVVMLVTAARRAQEPATRG